MSRRVIFITLAVFILTGAILAMTVYDQGKPTDVTEQPEEPQEPAASEPSSPEVMTVGDFISKLVAGEYQKSMKGEEPTIRERTTVRILGRVEGFRVGGEHPYFRGEVDLKPYYCSRRVQCIFSGEAVAQLAELETEMDVVIEGKYGGMRCFQFSHDICRLIDCSLLSIEDPQAWTVPMSEEMTGDAMPAGYLVNVQSRFRRGDSICIFGSIYSVAIDWTYLEGMWGDVLVTLRLDLGTECRFEGEEVYKIMKLPEGQDVIIEGEYSHGSASRAFLSNCSLICPVGQQASPAKPDQAPGEIR